MGSCKDMWIAEHERIGEDYACGVIDRDEAETRLTALGLDPHEIKDGLDELDQDRETA